MWLTVNDMYLVNEEGIDEDDDDHEDCWQYIVTWHV